MKGTVEHVDLVIVKGGEKATVEVPLHVIGADEEGRPGDRDGSVDHQPSRSRPPTILAAIEIDVTALGHRRFDRRQRPNLPEGAVFW